MLCVCNNELIVRDDQTNLKKADKCGVFSVVFRFLAMAVLLLVMDGAHAGAASAGSGLAYPVGVAAPSQQPAPNTGTNNAATDSSQITSRVICNVIKYVRSIGLPIMTGVIVGSSIMAVFGRLAWPAIAALIIFTGVFFGADKIISKFAEGVISSGEHGCS